MALSQSPSIVRDGLVLYYDMNNIKKSFLGKPTVNELAVPTPASDGSVTFQVQGTGTFYRITSGNYGGYQIQASDVVYKYDLGLVGCHYHGTQKAVTPGVTYTFSFDYYVSKDALDYPSTNLLANIEVYETSTGTWVYQTGSSVNDPTPSIKGVWKTATFSLTIPSGLVAPYANMLLYPGACGNTKMASSGFVMYKNPQCEVSSFATPFVSGSRTNTQAIFDLTGQNSVTANSLTYSSNNTFSFNGSSDLIVIANNTTLDTNNPSIEVWVKPNTLSQNGFWFEKGTVNSQYSLFQEGSNICFRTKPSGTYDSLYGSSSVLSTTAYTHVVAVKTDAEKIIYINGNKTYSKSYTDTITTTTGGMSIGAYGGYSGGRGYYYNGSLDSVKIYNRSLSASEVLQNFNAQRGRYGV